VADVREPSIDIIVNNYDYGPYLRDSIDSALAQTYRNVGIVVVDDGSTDGSRDVIESYAGRVVSILKANGGQASAFNAGFARSRADVVLFLDADDVLLPETCGWVAAAFVDQPSTARVQYRTEVIDETGNRTGIMKPPAYVRLPSGDLRRHAIAFPFDVPWMATSGNAFSAEALRRIAPIPEDDFRILADWYIVHLTSLLGTVVSLDKVGAYRRVHGRNVHELSQPVLDLVQLRQSIEAAQRVSRYLRVLARELGLADELTKISAVSDIGNRLISLRLGADSHPLPGDTRRALVAAGVRAALRRFDVNPAMRVVFIGWLVAEALAPQPLARRLADLFVFPERRGRMNPILAGLRRY
jgi:glycosyltransferase involved in cell wall biosynthesis